MRTTTTRLTRVIRLLLILSALQGLLHSEIIFNVTSPINTILQNGSNDELITGVLRKVAVGRYYFLYSTGNETLGLFYNVPALMHEMVPGIGLDFQLDQGNNVDLDAVLSSALEWDKKRRNTTSSSSPPLLATATPHLTVFVNWDNNDDNAPTRCSSADAAENLRKTFRTLKALDSMFPNVTINPHLAYSRRAIGCHHLLSIIEEKDPYLMLTIDFPVEEGNHHAQHIFDDFASDAIRANEKFIPAAIYRYYKYYSFRLLPASGSQSVPDKDHVLFHKFAQVWEAESNDDKTVVLNTFNFNLASNPSLLRMIEGRMSYPRNLIVPFVGGRGWDGFQIPVAALLCEVAAKFDAVEVDSQIWNQLFEIDLIICTTNTSGTAPLKLNLFHISTNETLSADSNQRHSSSWSFTPPPGVKRASVLLQYPKCSSNNSSRGCYIRFGNLPEVDGTQSYLHSQLINLTISECSAMMLHHQQASVVLWEFDLVNAGLKRSVTNPNYYTTTLRRQLSMISSQIDLLTASVPGTQIALKLVSRSPTRSQYSWAAWCDERYSKSRQIFTLVLSWAYLNNVTLFLDTKADAGFAHVLLKNKDSSIPPELKEIVRKWPEFVSRNYPSNLDGFYPWGQDPCLEDFNPGSSSQPIKFDEFAGASLNMTLREEPLNHRELQTLLQFAFHRFSSLEIVLGGTADGRTLLAALSADFLQFLEGVDLKVVYIYIPNAQLLQERDLQVVVNSISNSLKDVQKVRFGGVHVFSSPETGDMNRVIHHLKGVVPMMYGVRVGLVLNRCEQFVATLLNSTTSPSAEHAHGKIDYLVCSMPGSDPWTTSDWHWYIARVLKKRFPALNLYFKSELFSGGDTSSQHIETLNVTTNFAALHKLNYFVVNVASHSSTTAGFGWWNITDYSDLADTKVYVEHEAVLLGQPTWTPKPFNEGLAFQETFFSKWSTWIINGSIGTVLLITVISLAVWICVLRRRVVYLSKQEIYEFRNGGGGVPLGNGEELDLYSTLKYNNSYELSKPELNLESATLLGMGNFGQVRKASVKGNLAAIKVPHDNCSRESFKSMLIEVKVMCHLGSHPNLVELVGCHTSEIERGMIYIVTVLCEHGSLLSCLKNQEVVVQFQDMVKFGHEIAVGMDYIAGKHVVHGDLSTRNVLLDGHNICKIGDFGLSRKLYQYSMYVKQSQEPLPWRWMAYESLFKMEFTSMSDVWSYGVTLWEIFSLGAVPYPGLHWTVDFVEELKNGMRMNTPEFATPEIYNMMLKCWDLDPRDRPTFQDLVQFFIPFRDAEYQVLDD